MLKLALVVTVFCGCSTPPPVASAETAPRSYVRVTGTVLDDLGRACANAEVSEARDEDHPHVARQLQRVLTNEDGWFDIEIGPDTTQLVATSPTGARSLRCDVSRASSERVRGFIVTVPAERGPTSITGRIFDIDGLAPARPRLMHDARTLGCHVETTIDEDGSFRIDCHEPMKLRVWAMDAQSGRVSNPVEYEAGVHDRRITLGTGGCYTVSVTEADGTAPQSVLWYVQSSWREERDRNVADLLEGTFVCPLVNTTDPFDESGTVELVVYSLQTGASARQRLADDGDGRRISLQLAP